MRNVLELEVLYKNGSKDKIGMVVWNIFNGGYAARNQQHVREHIEELAKVGYETPGMFPHVHGFPELLSWWGTNPDYFADTDPMGM